MLSKREAHLLHVNAAVTTHGILSAPLCTLGDFEMQPSALSGLVRIRGRSSRSVVAAPLTCGVRALVRPTLTGGAVIRKQLYLKLAAFLPSAGFTCVQTFANCLTCGRFAVRLHANLCRYAIYVLRSSPQQSGWEQNHR
jgi:hypothetical protein